MTEEALKEKANWTPNQSRAEALTSAQSEILKTYEEDPRCAGKEIFDLTQSAKQKTTSLKDGCLQTITTNCRTLWSRSHKRLMAAEEALLNMGVPVIERAANAAGIDIWDMPAATSNMYKMAGNGMHVPSVGLVALLTMVYVQVKLDMTGDVTAGM